ncbi:MAG: archease, partial [Nanoarchaeota archaeon]|nr:archease [Nanoarchaeota archaeon]
LEHTADIKFQAYGKNLEETFENSALALLESVYGGKVKTQKTFKFSIDGKDLGSLMYNFLEEFLFLIDAKHFLAGKVRVKISKDNKRLDAEVIGDDSSNYDLDMHIKAITYNDMFIEEKNGKWIAQVVLDI